MTILIIGGGLSGLALADALAAIGEEYLLVEARQRFGGRIMTEYHGDGYFDMGPAWFWHGQLRIAALVERLGLKKFDQFVDGDAVFENETGAVQRGQGFASMKGSWRLEGGLAALTKALTQAVENDLPDDRMRLNSTVIKLEKSTDHILATLANGETLKAEKVVFALPPRLVSKMEFSPELPMAAMAAMKAVPTWMAGQAKAVAVYDHPFWRNDRLSGDAVSRKGPMVEIHDASPDQGGPYGLFGFIGVPPNARADERLLRKHLLAQLVRLFGPKANNPAQLYVKDWAFDPHTSINEDLEPIYMHPTYGLPRAMVDLWEGALYFSGTEVAPVFGGYIEGALEAAEIVVKQFKK